MRDYKPFDNDEHRESVRQANRDLQTWHEPHRMSPARNTTQDEQKCDGCEDGCFGPTPCPYAGDDRK